jgi:linoleoyl-CoA desaturase
VKPNLFTASFEEIFPYHRNGLLTWFFGGLNFQIEYHLFSGICHVHFKKLAPIVKATTAEYGIPYHVEPTFRQALAGHVKMLKKLGRE